MKTIIAFAAAAVLTAAPAMADGIVGGVFGGVASSHSSGGSFSASGGLAAGGASGTSFVRNEQSAGQLSGAFASLNTVAGDHTLKGTLVTETFTDGFSESRSTIRDNGVGTIGAGAGWATNWGEADAAGAFGGIGADW